MTVTRPFWRIERSWDVTPLVDRPTKAKYTWVMTILSSRASGEGRLDSTEVARLVVDVASDKLAEDIVLLDLRQIAPFADYFVIMSAGSSRQIQALEEDLTEAMEKEQVKLFHREGTAQSGWVLLDFSNVLVHVFGPEQREFYGLERLWARAPQVVRIQ